MSDRCIYFQIDISTDRSVRLIEKNKQLISNRID